MQGEIAGLADASAASKTALRDEGEQFTTTPPAENAASNKEEDVKLEDLFNGDHDEQLAMSSSINSNIGSSPPNTMYVGHHS